MDIGAGRYRAGRGLPGERRDLPGGTLHVGDIQNFGGSALERALVRGPCRRDWIIVLDDRRLRQRRTREERRQPEGGGSKQKRPHPRGPLWMQVITIEPFPAVCWSRTARTGRSKAASAFAVAAVTSGWFHQVAAAIPMAWMSS
jgi:hypothetical protein